MSTGQGAQRIGEFSRRVGVSPDLLRAWERRYGLLDPARSPGGFRLYGDDDAERVARMRQGVGSGLSAAQAAQAAIDGGASVAGPLIDDARARLLHGIERYDEAVVQAVLDEGLAAFGLETFLRDLVLPALSEVGLRWQRGEAEVSQEHFASNIIRARLLALARLWGRGSGPLALLACAPGERHDISLVAFGLLLRSHGWRILFLGADTPLSTMTQAARAAEASAVVLVTFDAELLRTEAPALTRLARVAPVFLSGPGAGSAPSRGGRLQVLDGDLINAVGELANTRID